MNESVNNDHATTDRLAERAHESVDRVARTAGKGEERLRHDAAYAESRVKEAGEKARERTDETLEAVSGFVRENPLTSLGLAFAAGSLFSAWRRR